MSEYQAVYDAVRSRIGGIDIGDIVQSAFRDAQLGHFIERAANAVIEAGVATQECSTAPSAVYRPALSIDGNQWCALYGDNLQDGVAGFGDSPALAMADFDNNWKASLPARAA